jgi:hypothetical protein
MTLKHWFHHLLNPHCEQCRDEREMSQICDSCETLKSQLEIANYNYREVLKALLESSRPAPVTTAPDFEPIRPKTVPWPVRKQMMEEEDRRKAVAMRKNVEDQRQAIENNKQSINELEKELGVSDTGA